ncbi:unnamed protein product, partial [Iphiclides podalirius]
MEALRKSPAPPIINSCNSHNFRAGENPPSARRFRSELYHNGLESTVARGALRLASSRTLKLHLLTPPAYKVERLTSSDCGGRLCLFGSRGVTVAELPSRWGRGGLFDSGNKTVLCK